MDTRIEHECILSYNPIANSIMEALHKAIGQIVWMLVPQFPLELSVKKIISE